MDWIELRFHLITLDLYRRCMIERFISNKLKHVLLFLLKGWNHLIWIISIFMWSILSWLQVWLVKTLLSRVSLSNSQILVLIMKILLLCQMISSWTSCSLRRTITLLKSFQLMSNRSWLKSFWLVLAKWSKKIRTLFLKLNPNND